MSITEVEAREVRLLMVVVIAVYVLFVRFVRVPAQGLLTIHTYLIHVFPFSHIPKTLEEGEREIRVVQQCS